MRVNDGDVKETKEISGFADFCGGVVLCFSQNSAANVYADSYEDQYSKGTYTIETGEIKDKKYVQIDDGAWGEAVFNSIVILTKTNNRVSLKSSNIEDKVYRYEFASDVSGDDIIEISYNVRAGGRYEYTYISGFSCDVLNSSNAYDSDGDGVKDCLRFVVSSSDAKKYCEYGKYCKYLIIKPYNCQITIDPNGGQFKDGTTSKRTLIVSVGTTFAELIANNTTIAMPPKR